MEDILKRQRQLHNVIKLFSRNFRKVGRNRITSNYIRRRLKILDSYWEQYMDYHKELLKSELAHTYISEIDYEKSLQHYNSAKALIIKYGETSRTSDESLRLPTLKYFISENPGKSKPTSCLSTLHLRKFDEKTQVKLEWIGLVLMQYRCFSFQHNNVSTCVTPEELKYIRLVALLIIKRKFKLPDVSDALRCLQEYVAVYEEQLPAAAPPRPPRWLLLARRAVGAPGGTTVTMSSNQAALVSAIFLIIEHHFRKYANESESQIIDRAADSVAVNRKCLWSWWLGARWTQWATSAGQDVFTSPEHIASSRLLLRAAHSCGLQSAGQLRRARDMCRAGGLAGCAASLAARWSALRQAAAARVLLRRAHCRMSAPHPLYLAVVKLFPHILAEYRLAGTGYEQRYNWDIQHHMTAPKEKNAEIAAESVLSEQPSDTNLLIADDDKVLMINDSDDQTPSVSEHQKMIETSNSETSSDDDIREPLRFDVRDFDFNSKDRYGESEADDNNSEKHINYSEIYMNNSQNSDNAYDKESYLAKNTMLLELLNTISEPKVKETGQIQELEILDPNRAEAIISFDDDDDDDFGDNIHNFLGNNRTEDSTNVHCEDNDLSQDFGSLSINVNENSMVKDEDIVVKTDIVTHKVCAPVVCGHPKETYMSDIIDSCIESKFKSNSGTSVPKRVIDEKLLLCPQVVLMRLEMRPFWQKHQKDGAIDLSVMTACENIRKRSCSSDQSSLDFTVTKRPRSCFTSDDLLLDVVKCKKPRLRNFSTESSAIDGAESSKLECFAYMSGSVESMMRFCRPIDVRLKRLPNILIERHKSACKFRICSMGDAQTEGEHLRSDSPLPSGAELDSFLTSLETTPGAIAAMMSVSPPAPAPVEEPHETLLSILMRSSDNQTPAAFTKLQSKATRPSETTSKPGSSPPVRGEPCPAPRARPDTRTDGRDRCNLSNMQLIEKESTTKEKEINRSETETNTKETEKEAETHKREIHRKEIKTHTRVRDIRRKEIKTHRKEPETTSKKTKKTTNKEQRARKPYTRDRDGNKTASPTAIGNDAIQSIDLVSDDDSNSLENVTDIDTPVTDNSDTVKVKKPKTSVTGESGQTGKKKTVTDNSDTVKVKKPKASVTGESGQTGKKKTKGERTCEVCGLKEGRATIDSWPFFRFPQDPVRCRWWLKRIGNEELVNLSIQELRNQRAVCAKHFRRWDITSSGWLKPRAIPMLGLTAAPLTKQQLGDFPWPTAKNTDPSLSRPASSRPPRHRRWRKMTSSAPGDFTAMDAEQPLNDAYQEWQRQKTLCDQYFKIPNMMREEKKTNVSSNDKRKKRKGDKKDKDENKASLSIVNSKNVQQIDLTLDDDDDDSDSDSDCLEIDLDCIDSEQTVNDSVSAINVDVDENVTDNNDIGNIVVDKNGSKNAFVARKDTIKTTVTVADNIYIFETDVINNVTINNDTLISITDKNNVDNSVTGKKYSNNLSVQSECDELSQINAKNKTESTTITIKSATVKPDPVKVDTVSNETGETVTLTEMTTVVPDEIDNKNFTDKNDVKIEQNVFSSNKNNDLILNIEPKTEKVVENAENLFYVTDSNKDGKEMSIVNQIDRFQDIPHVNVNYSVNSNNNASSSMFDSPNLNKAHEYNYKGPYAPAKDLQDMLIGKLQNYVNEVISTPPWVKVDNSGDRTHTASGNHLNMDVNQPNMNVNQPSLNVNQDDRNVNHIHINLNQNPTINQWSRIDQVADVNQMNQHNMNVNQYAMNVHQSSMNMNHPSIIVNHPNINQINPLITNNIINPENPMINQWTSNIINQPNQNVIVNNQMKPLFLQPQNPSQMLTKLSPIRLQSPYQPVYQLNQPKQTFSMPISLSVNHSPILQIQPMCSQTNQNKMAPEPPITQSPYIQIPQIQQMDSSQQPVVSFNITAQPQNDNQQISIQSNIGSKSTSDVTSEYDESAEVRMPIITQVESLFEHKLKSDESAEIIMPIISQVTSLADEEDIRKLFPNENVTPRLVSLFKQTKEFAAEYNYDFCWIKHGNIYVQRKGWGCLATWIKDERYLEWLRHVKSPPEPEHDTGPPQLMQPPPVGPPTVHAADLHTTDGLLLFDNKRPPKPIDGSKFLVTRRPVLPASSPVYWTLAPYSQSKVVVFPETRTQTMIKVKSFARSLDANALCESETAAPEAPGASEAKCLGLEIIDGNVYKRIRGDTLVAVLTEVSSLVLSGRWQDYTSVYVYDSATGQVLQARQVAQACSSDLQEQVKLIVTNKPITFQNLIETDDGDD